MITFDELRNGNIARDKIWDPEDKISAAFRAIELAGEVGEAMNNVKKFLRECMGLTGSRISMEDMAKEFADIIICTDLLAMEFDLDLGEAVKQKFNETSKKHGFEVRL